MIIIAFVLLNTCILIQCFQNQFISFSKSHINDIIYKSTSIIDNSWQLKHIRQTKHVNNHNIPNQMALYGIPKLFRWLIDLYPIVLESVREGISSKDAMTIDNFYLDMNGIIHACTHSNNDKLIDYNEVQMFNKIFTYTDNLFKLVRPSKLMFLAVDGVAPRAKMNQQRSRRFRSSKEREILLAEYVAKEGKLPDVESFDSNCITPGTEFMHRLGIAFQKWIEYKMKTDKFWQDSGAKVIFSGPDVPGEGEHKVMDLIRTFVDEPNYKIGSLKHCMYGLDADLIMLSLVTHEPHFVLLREKIFKRNSVTNKPKSSFSPEDFELLEITLLREMLKQHFRKLGQVSNDDINVEDSKANNKLGNSFGKFVATDFDVEKVIDDFVFMCFFVGNDFLPSIPHLDISDGSLNLMMNVYRDMVPIIGGYLTNGNSLHLPRIELFIQEISRREPLYFEQRAVDEKEPQYGDERYKAFYYKTKFGIDYNDKAAIREIVKAYVQGLAWVLTYYHKGCGSWTWYYPYLYAPLASDLIDLADIELQFDQGTPFTPLLQLLSVLPPQSGKFLPPSYQNSMTSPSSPLYEYYPRDFEVDLNGKKNSWECIVKIPFINETILVDAISIINHDKELTSVEKIRNIRGKEHQVISKTISKDSNQLGSQNANWGNALLDDKRIQSRKQEYQVNNTPIDSKKVYPRRTSK